MTILWPNTWRDALAEAFDATIRPSIPQVHIIVVGENGCYTGEVCRLGSDVGWTYDPTLVGQFAEGITKRNQE